MELNDSEVLFLSQVLFHIKVAGGMGYSSEDRLDSLYEKLTSYLVSDGSFPRETIKDDHNLDKNEQECCSWYDCQDESQEEDEGKELDEYKHEFHYLIKSDQLLDLDSVRVDYKGSRKTLKFSAGILNRGVDIEFDGEDEFICDLQHILRKGNELHANTGSGWVVFKVQKFPKSWTALLPLDEIGRVQEDR